MSDRSPGSGPLARPLASPTDGCEPRREATSRALGDARQPAHQQLPSAVHRLSSRQLALLAEKLPVRDRAVLESVSRFRLLRADQLQRLFFAEINSPTGRARICRRSLKALSDLRLLRRLDRRVGGSVNGGSSGYVYALAPAGRRLLAYWAGEGLPSSRGIYQPQPGHVEHTLAIAELYVRLRRAEQRGCCELLVFDPEPDCWRSYSTATGQSVLLKPDALIRLGIDAYELSWFCEIDRATHGRGALQRKLRAYLSYYQTGREQTATGVFPRVAWITPDDRRERILDDLIDQLGHADRRLFATTTTEQTVSLLLTGGNPR
jgi:Replication-relaxation